MMVNRTCSASLFHTGASRQCTDSRRTFIQSAISHYPTPKALPTPRPGKAAPSMRATQRQGIKETNVPQDLGLMNGTFIMPSGNNKPSLLGRPGSRVRLEWFRLKKRFMDFAGVLSWKYAVTKKPTPRPTIAFRSIGPTARALHDQMWTAFADQDITVLRTLCAEGLYNLLASRIAARSRNEIQRWKSHSNAQRPQVVSHRATMIPVIPRSALRQAVVRLTTKQSLERLLPDGRVVSGTGEVKEFIEYIVIQKRILKEKEEPWIVWGTTEESHWETIQKQS